MDQIPEGSVESAVSNAGAIFPFITVIFSLIGVFIMLFTIWQCIQAFLKQDIGRFVRSLVFGGTAALLCLNLNLGIGLIKAGSGLVQSLTDTVSNTLSGDGGSAPAGTAPDAGVPLPK